MEKSYTRHPSSYRDPSGFVFIRDAVLYRQVNKVYAADFGLLNSSGLYSKLIEKKWLIPHETINQNLTGNTDWHTTLKPEPVAVITYPYEWSFDMLKDAALLTLQITRTSIEHGMILKDASAFNIQWHKGRPCFIDSLSFEKYDEKEPWIAYRQFCEHFLGPLVLMHYRKTALQPMQMAWPDGIPLHIVSSLLPWRSRLSLHTYLHIHLNARVAVKGDKAGKSVKFSKQKLLNLLLSLETLIRKLQLPVQKTNWSDYYDEASGRGDYLDKKMEIIRKWLASFKDVNTVVDLGANDGVFSQLSVASGFYTIASDMDPYCINNLYLAIKKAGSTNLHPLIADLSNPSPAIGVNNEERTQLTERIRSDAGMALALVHHLAIGKNIPFSSIAEFFARVVNKYLIIEFVPKTDEKVTLMLRGKKDIYTSYNEEKFAKEFGDRFRLIEKQPVGDSGRVMYLLCKHES
jgi:hypothetical protein